MEVDCSRPKRLSGTKQRQRPSSYPKLQALMTATRALAFLIPDRPSSSTHTPPITDGSRSFLRRMSGPGKSLVVRIRHMLPPQVGCRPKSAGPTKRRSKKIQTETLLNNIDRETFLAKGLPPCAQAGQHATSANGASATSYVIGRESAARAEPEMP